MLLMRIFKANHALFSFLSLVLFASLNAAADPIIIPAPPELAAKSYLLVDAKTGKVLVEKNADEELSPASLTKMMTSYVVINEILSGRIHENDMVPVSDNAWRKGNSASGGSTMFLEDRSTASVMDMLRGVIVQSGNDASIALAEYVAGSEEGFADVMNQQAALLGMKHSHFVNATGLTAEGHYTTARDLAILAKAVINDHPKYYEIYAERSFTYNGHPQLNRNKLLFTNKFVDGIKTGHTNDAGYCLVASEKHDDMRLISVLLGASSENGRAAESQRLLAYGFRYYQTAKLYAADKAIDGLSQRVWKGETENIDLVPAKDVYATIPRGSQGGLVAQTHINKIIEAPLKKGQELGELEVQLDGNTVAKAPLLAANDVPEAGFFSRLWDSAILLFK